MLEKATATKNWSFICNVFYCIGSTIFICNWFSRQQFEEEKKRKKILECLVEGIGLQFFYEKWQKRNYFSISVTDKWFSWESRLLLFWNRGRWFCEDFVLWETFSVFFVRSLLNFFVNCLTLPPTRP